MNQDAMRVESCSRMIALGLPSSVIDEFKENNKLYCSEAGRFVEVPAKILERVIEWQKVSKCLVYHVIHAFIYGIETYEFLYTSCYREDWDFESSIMADDWVMVRSENQTIPDFSESGSIQVAQTLNGCLVRIH